MLLEDYVLGFCFWWSALISLGIAVLPDFDAPGRRSRVGFRDPARRSG